MKKRLITLGLISATIFTTGCGFKDNIQPTKTSLYKGKFEIIKEYTSDSGATYEVKDPETGIHYYMDSGNSSMITPVIEKDGSIRGAIK